MSKCFIHKKFKHLFPFIFIFQSLEQSSPSILNRFSENKYILLINIDHSSQLRYISPILSFPSEFIFYLFYFFCEFYNHWTCDLIFIAVPLGSIAELPALSCHEIKLSEGKDTISKMYWLDPTGIGKAELLYCDMKLEGKWVLHIKINLRWVFYPVSLSCRLKECLLVIFFRFLSN